MTKRNTAGIVATSMLCIALVGCAREPEPKKRQGAPFESAVSAEPQGLRRWLPSFRSSPEAPPPQTERTTTRTSETSVAGIVTTRSSTTTSEAGPAHAAVPDTRQMSSEEEMPRLTERTPRSGILTAGDHDDLLNPKAYANYAESFLQQGRGPRGLPFVDTRNRMEIRVVDANGRPVPLARVEVLRDTMPLTLTTSAAGIAFYHPAFDGVPSRTIVKVSSDAGEESIPVQNGPGMRTTTIRLLGLAPTIRALDVAIVLDTTGSMEDEMEFIQSEIVSIVDRVKKTAGDVDVRIGLIAYKDESDEYLVRSFGMNTSAEEVSRQIMQMSARGGGDVPEAMDMALDAAEALPWRKDAVKAVLLVADAPPHDERIKRAFAAARAMRGRGIQIVSVAASETDETAQYVMRAMAAMTQGRYVFLTDDSGVGNAHAEPDVACYRVTRLDRLLVRILAGVVSGKRVEAPARDVIRTVGSFKGGRCVGEQ